MNEICCGLKLKDVTATVYGAWNRKDMKENRKECNHKFMITNDF